MRTLTTPLPKFPAALNILLNILTPVVPIIWKNFCATCEFLAQSSILALACSIPLDTPLMKGDKPANATLIMFKPLAIVLKI